MNESRFDWEATTRLVGGGESGLETKEFGVRTGTNAYNKPRQSLISGHVRLTPEPIKACRSFQTCGSARIWRAIGLPCKPQYRLLLRLFRVQYGYCLTKLGLVTNSGINC